MQKLAAIFILLFSLSSKASGWSVGAKSLEVSRCPSQYCLISSTCLKNLKVECQALKAMKNKVQSDAGPGGTNPGSGVCQKHYQGSVFVARDDQQNEVAFCSFKDGSFLSLDGLWRW